jgi:nicotinamide riboside kinase
MKKIVIIGPESTGKSTLCEQLANKYGTLWCPEFARQYLLKHGMEYSYDDLLTIAKGQIDLENKFVEEVTKAESRQNESDLKTGSDKGSQQESPEFLFIDTDMYVMKVWCEVVFENCHTWVLKQIAKRQYDLFLLCDVDLPWVKDELREYPDLEFRKNLFKMYRDLLINQKTKWAEISGTDTQRLQMAVSIIDTVFGRR